LSETQSCGDHASPRPQSRYCDGAGPGEILLGPLTNQEVAGYFVITEKGVSTKHEGVLPAFSVDWQAHLAANA